MHQSSRWPSVIGSRPWTLGQGPFYGGAVSRTLLYIRAMTPLVGIAAASQEWLSREVESRKSRACHPQRAALRELSVCERSLPRRELSRAIMLGVVGR
jgi:hypothetical protein